MHTFGQLFFLASTLSVFGAIPPDGSDRANSEGWRAEGFPVDDYVPWNLLMDSKRITEMDGKYLVVFGYLVASPSSILLFTSKDASDAGNTEGALILATNDSPAMRWLFPRRQLEGYYAVGGVFIKGQKDPILGHLTKIRFAMKKEEWLVVE